MKKIDIVLAAVSIVAWLIIQAPTPEFFLIGADGGHQLAGATQILSLGEHPYVDFFETYGPLTFYSSALAQYLSGMRPIGEVSLIILGYGVGYLLLFILLRQVLKNTLASFLLLFLALLLLPQFYKYYCVLIPMFSLFCASLYISTPSSAWRFLLLGLSVAVAALYRHDFGVFSFIMVMVLLGTEFSVNLKDKIIKLIMFCAVVLLLMAPWLAFLIWKGAFMRYLNMIFYASTSISKGLSLPHPLFHWANPLLSISFLFFFIIPLLGAALFWRQRKKMPINDGSLLLAAAVLSAVSLLQSSHRADFYHLLEGIPPTFVCLAFIIRYGLAKNTQMTLVYTVFCSLLILLPTVYATPSSILPAKSRLDIGRKMSYYILDRQSYIDRLVRTVPSFWPAKAVQEVRENTQPGSRVAFFPFHMKFNYFADRPFAAGIMLLAPGYFDAAAYQQEAIVRLRQQKVSCVLWNERFTFDGLPERNPVVIYAALHEAVERDYLEKGLLYGFTVYELRRP